VWYFQSHFRYCAASSTHQNDRKKKPSKASGGGIDGVVLEGQMDGSDPLLPEAGAEPGSEAGGGDEDEEDDQKRHSQKIEALRKVSCLVYSPVSSRSVLITAFAYGSLAECRLFL
jgi:hypothetical protein